MHIEHQRFVFSVISRYEILRGLHAKAAKRQIAAFEQLCTAITIVPVSRVVAEQAAQFYADLRNRGALVGDADMLIGATALVHGYTLISNNEAHFMQIAGLATDNWLRPTP